MSASMASQVEKEARRVCYPRQDDYLPTPPLAAPHRCRRPDRRNPPHPRSPDRSAPYSWLTSRRDDGNETLPKNFLDQLRPAPVRRHVAMLIGWGFRYHDGVYDVGTALDEVRKARRDVGKPVPGPFSRKNGALRPPAIGLIWVSVAGSDYSAYGNSGSPCSFKNALCFHVAVWIAPSISTKPAWVASRLISSSPTAVLM